MQKTFIRIYLLELYLEPFFLFIFFQLFSLMRGELVYRRRTVYRVLAGRAGQLGLETLLAEGLRYYRRYPTLAPHNLHCLSACPPATRARAASTAGRKHSLQRTETR